MIESLVGTLIIIAAIVVLVRMNVRLGALEREVAALRALRQPTQAATLAASADPVRDSDAPAESQPVFEPAEALTGQRQGATFSEEPPAPIEVDQTGAGWMPGADDAPPPHSGATKQKLDIETALGTRWAVWVGGLALALGALFLIRYSIEAGIFGPEVRLVLAALLGVALAGAGEFLRRTGYDVPVGGLPVAHVPAILTAAGAFALFGAVYAAHALYGFIGAGLAFPLLGLVALLTIVSALLHGRALGGIGLLGAMATPALIASTAPNHWALFVYLAVVLAGAVWIARLRYWPFLAGAAFAGAGLWGMLYIGGQPLDLSIVLFHHAVMLAVLGLVWHGGGGAELPPERVRAIDRATIVPAFVVAFACLFLMIAPDLYEAAGRDRIWTGAIISVAALGVAFFKPRALALVHGVGAFLLVSAARIGLAGSFAIDLPAAYLEFDGPDVLPHASTLRDSVAAVAGVLAVSGALFARRHVALYPLRSGAWMLWAVLGPLALLSASWVAFGNLDRDLVHAAVAFLAAVVFAVAGEAIARSEAPPLAGGFAVSAAFAGAFAASALMVHMVFGPGMTTVLVAALAAVAACASRWRSFSVLGWAAVAAAAVTLGRVALDPTIVGAAQLGTMPFANWLLPGYGLPAAAFGYAAWQFARSGSGRPRHVMEAAASLFALLCTAMLVRHAMNGGVIDAATPTLAEQSIYTLIAIGAGGAFIALDARAPSPVFRVGSLAVGVLGALFVFIQHFQVLNPLFTGEATGRIPFFNLLLIAYLLPGAAAAAVAWFARGKRPNWYVAMLALLGAALAFAYATLSLRRLFHGEVLALWKGMGQIETYAYSALWLVLGVALLVAGTGLRSQVLRLGSGALIAIAVAKVFLFDMSELEGVLRALSFIGLGAVLIGIGLFYQRLLTRSRAE